MSKNLIPLEIYTRTSRTTKTTIKLSGRQILELLKDRVTDDIPEDADITFSIPGGGDWSNQDLDFKDDSLVTVSYTITSE